jgi:hypothetical protein
MATPADQRLLELLDKWLKSLELHAKYSSLDDDSYWKIQPWTEHQRPNRWILDLAKQKTLALRNQVEERMQLGDAKFSDSLELMIFLANLVGSEHIERFIPVAELENERSLTASPPSDAATLLQSATATREMPKFQGARRNVPPPAGTAQVARTERKAAIAPAKSAARPVPTKPPPRPAAKLPAKTLSGADAAASPAAARAATANTANDLAAGPGGASGAGGNSGGAAARVEQVVGDAVRLVQWGRKWYELPELIARMADRPTLPEVRRILRENKAAIDKKAGNK